MPEIDFEIIREVIEPNDAELPVNLVIVQRIPSNASGPKIPRPEPISNMVEVAQKTKPGFEILLKDQAEKSVKCSVEYSSGVESTNGLVDHLSSDWVHHHLIESDQNLNVQQRLLAREAAVE